ncbi:MAG: glycosyltransferase family 87 protein [Chloroflexota bacterium]
MSPPRLATRIWARRQVLGWGVFAGALVYSILVLTGNARYHGDDVTFLMGDAAAYYYTATPYDWTDDAEGVGEFRYAPAFLWVTAPLRLLPWELFAAVWFGLHIAVLLYLRVPWMLAFIPVMDDALWGNIYTFQALAVVLIVRHGTSSLWATVLLTKVTPGVGLGWHLGRREWRAFATALGVTVLIIGIGFAVNAEIWAEWLAALRAAPENYPGIGDSTTLLILRMAIGGAIAVLAGKTGRTWLLPIGMLVAVPGFFIYSFALLLASVVLYLDARAARSAQPGVVATLAGQTQGAS